MSKTIMINGVEVETVRLASFAFALHTADPTHPESEELALLRVDDVRGAPMIVKGPDAVTLKVLLASLGLRDLSGSWDGIPDPRTNQSSSRHGLSSASAAGSDFPPDG